MAGSVISEVLALTCVVVSKAEKNVPYGEILCTSKCINLYPRFRTNGLQLYLYCKKKKKYHSLAFSGKISVPGKYLVLGYCLCSNIQPFI